MWDRLSIRSAETTVEVFVIPVATVLSSVGTAIDIIAAIAAVVGLVVTGWKIIRDGGAADARRIDEAQDLKQTADDLKGQVEAVQEQLEALRKAITPNGKDTDGIGDIAARIEDLATEHGKALKEIREDFQEHLGASKKEHELMWNRIEKAA